MATSKVINLLVGSTNKAKYPAVQGTELSVNMFHSDNGSVSFLESVPGLQRIFQINGKCRGTYVSTRGLDSERSTEDMFAAMGNVVYRLKENEKTKLFSIAPGSQRVCFAETGGVYEPE